MAITQASALARVKEKLDIASGITIFDTIITDCLQDSMPRLGNFFQYDMPEDTTVTLATSADSFNLPNVASVLQKMFIRTNTNEVWRNFDYWNQHGSKIYLYDSIPSLYYVMLLARRSFVWLDSDLALMPVEAEAPLYMFACSEFATVIAGNKRKFNIYQQTNGARSLDEMTKLAEWYDQRATRMCEDAISSEGR